MFCTVKQNKNKYAIYLSERVRKDGKVKSKDKYIFSLKGEEIENKAYKNRVQYTTLSDEEKQLVINKLDNMEIPLQGTTNEKTLHTTTRIEVKSTDCNKVIEYDFYVDNKLICSFDSLDLENMRLSFLIRLFLGECEENGVDKNCDHVKDIADEITGLWEYHKFKEEKIEQAKIEAASYYENTIMALKIKIAELQNSSGSIKHTTTIDQTKVKKIYRALANKLHPDNGGSDELMQMLNELKDMIS